jgi:hypothetical protein
MLEFLKVYDVMLAFTDALCPTHVAAHHPCHFCRLAWLLGKQRPEPFRL